MLEEVFLVLAALWVLAWVVLIVLGLVNLIFKPLSDPSYTVERGVSDTD